jgi:hypothetical protein
VLDSNRNIMSGESPDAAGRDGGIGRREFVAGVGSVAALGMGGAVLHDQEPPEGSSYILQQGYLRWEVDPLVDADQTAGEFYGYDSSSGTGIPAAEIIEEPAAARLFVYSGPVDDSIVFLNGATDTDRGGTAFYAFSGLSRDQGEWAVRDDPMGVDDDFEKWAGGNGKVRWEWDAGETDGGVFYGALGRQDYTISINPRTLRGVDTWRFLAGTPGATRYVDLYPGKPAKLTPTKGTKSVRRANVEIMPEREANVFDPYASEERMTVAVHEPPTDATNPDDWVSPTDLDPGNYALNFGSKSYLAGQNAAQPQKYFRNGGSLYLQYNLRAAQFTLDSAYGYLVGKADEHTFVRGRDVVKPGGYDNTDDEAGLTVSDLHVDLAADAPLTEEWVEFRNDGTEPVDMTGYIISDAEGWEFFMPDGFTLGAGESFRLHTGDGEYGPDHLYWDVQSAVWDADSDTITVTDADGNRVIKYAY